MATKEQLLTALRKADAAGDTAAASAIARALKAMYTPVQADPSFPMGVLRGVNKGLGAVLAPPYDVGAFAVEKITGEPTRSYQERFVGADPVSAQGRIARAAGDMAGIALPIGAGMNLAGRVIAKAPAAARAGKSFVRKAISDMLVSRSAAPVSTLAGDAIGGLGAGLGRQIVEESGMEPGALKSFTKGAAEITGGLAGEAVAPPLMVRAGIAAGRKGRDLYRTLFTDEGGIAPAASRVGEVVGSRESALRNLESEYSVPLTPAQKADDPGLYALQKAAMSEDQNAADAIRALNAENRARLTQQLSELKGPGGDPQIAVKRRAAIRTAAIRQQYENRIGEINRGVADSSAQRAAKVNERKQYLDNLAAQARQTADEQIARLAPDISEEEASRLYRAALDDAENEANAETKRLFEAVPQQTPVKTHPALIAYQDLQRRLPQAQQHQIEKYREYFVQNSDNPSRKFLGLQSNIKEVQGLRSELLADARSYNQPGQEGKRARAYELADALLKSLEGSEGMHPALKEALDFTRMTKQRFGQPDVSDVMGSTKTGASRVPDPETLRSMVGAGGPGATAGVEQAVTAVPGSEKIIESYLKNQFRRQVYPAGKFSVDAAEKFLTNNQTMLERFPEFARAARDSITASRNLKSDVSGIGQMKKEIDAAVRAATAAEKKFAVTATKEAAQSASARSARYTDKLKSYTAKFLKADPSQLLDTALSSPPGFARTVKNNVKDNVTAREGLRAAAIDRLMQKAGGGFDLDGRPVVSGSKLLGHINESRGVLSEWLTKDQVRRAEFIAEQLARIERSEAASPAVEGLSTHVPSKMISTAARVAGVRAMGNMDSGGGFGGSLQIANITSNRIREFVAKHTPDRVHNALVDAVMNEKGMTRLLTEIANTPVKKPVANRLPAWLITPSRGEERDYAQ